MTIIYKIVCSYFLLGIAFVFAGEPAPLRLNGMVPANSSLDKWLAGVSAHPKNLEKAAVRDAARHDLDATRLSFSDPVFRASTGSSETPFSIPATSSSGALPANAQSLQAGIEAPVVSGVYGAVGIAQRRISSMAESDGDNETEVGGLARIPLMKDRGFALNKRETQRLASVSDSAAADVRATYLGVSCEIVRAYSLLLLKIADAIEVERALERAETLVESAAMRAGLEDVAEYQIYPARYEAAVRREELRSVKGEIDLYYASLAEKLGLRVIPELTKEEQGTIFDWAAAVEQTDVTLLKDVAEKTLNPAIEKAMAEAESAGYGAARVREESRNSLDLNLGATWNTVDDNESGRGAGYEISLAFSRPLGGTGLRERVAAAESRTDAAKAALIEAEIETHAASLRAFIAFESARARLALARIAVAEAKRVLDAEDERFSLGEGSSRNVLDAQKDLTTATRRSLTVSYEVICAMTDLHESIGISPDFDYTATTEETSE